MAFTPGDFVNIETDDNTSDLSSYVTGSHSFVANRLYLVWCWGRDAGFTGTPTIPTATAAAGLVLTEAVSDNALMTDESVVLFRAMPSTNVTTDITFDFSGQVQTSCSWSVIEIQNTNTDGSNGSGAIVQTKLYGQTWGTDHTFDLDNAIAAGNAAVSGFGSYLASGKTVGTNETALGTPEGSDRPFVQYNLNGDETLDITVPSSTAVHAVGVEILSGVLTLDVTSINSGADIETGATGVSSAGTDFGTITSVTQSGVALSFANATATSVDIDTLDIESTLFAYGDHVFELTNDALESDTVTGTVIPTSTHDYVDIVTPLVASGMRFTAFPDIADGDQIRYQKSLYLNNVEQSQHPVTVAPDGSVSVGGSPPNETYTVNARLWSDGAGWSDEVEQTFIVSLGGKDAVDATFDFTGVARDPLVTTALYAVAPAPADPGLLVYDDFSSETFTAPISGVNDINFSWISGINVYLVKQPALQPIQTSYLVGAITNIDDTNLNAPLTMPDSANTTRDWTDLNGVSGVSAMFRFRDEESDPTPAEINRAEITAHFDSQSEVWVNYRLRVPSNFSLNPLGNLDKMLAIYSDGYSGSGTGSTCWFDLGNDSSTPGSCRAYVVWSHGTGNGEPNEGTQGEYPDQQNGPVFATPADSGRWMEIAFHVKQESSIGANDGIVALYRKWEDIGTWETLVVATGLHIRESAVGDPGFQELYMVGPTSQGDPETYVEQTEWLIGSPYKLLSEPPAGLSQLPFSHDPAAGKVILDPNYDSTLNATYMADSGEDYKWNTVSASGTTISDDIPGYRGAYSFECFNTVYTDGDNEFGGAYTPNFPEAGEGDIIRIQIPMYLPATFNGSTNTGLLKFFRLHKAASSGGGHIGYIDVLISEALEQWHYGNEANTGDDATMTNYTYQKDRWELLEMHYKITATSAPGNVRGFVNIGGTMTEIFDITTETITDVAQVVDYFYLFTYWNGAPIPYKAGDTYSSGTIVIDNSIIYESNVDDNINNPPASSPTEWTAGVAAYPATDQTCYIGEVAILVNNETDLTELSDTGIKVIGGAR